jgi:AcrR family transcriptional regulator
MSESDAIGIRERTRRAVMAELTVIAQDLFLERGYEGTTVDAIASAAGMSKRTFFRYFGSKEDVVIGKYELFGDRMADALRDRPADESIWEALRNTFQATGVYFQDGPDRDRNAAMNEIVHSSPGLYAAYLEKFERMQAVVADAARERLGHDDPDAALRATVIVGAAFACLSAVGRRSNEINDQETFTSMLDTAMGIVSVHPRP